jgi:hypothetical protein
MVSRLAQAAIRKHELLSDHTRGLQEQMAAGCYSDHCACNAWVAHFRSRTLDMSCTMKGLLFVGDFLSTDETKQRNGRQTDKKDEE